MRALVAYGSKRGATAEIADAIAERLRNAGVGVDCLPAAEARHLESYDAVVVGSAVYMKRWRRDARRLLSRMRAAPEHGLWIFSSGPVGEEPDLAWAEPPNVVARAERLGARDHVVFGGRLPVEPGSFVERAMVRETDPANRDLRDWDEIRAWAGRITEELVPGDGTSPRPARGRPRWRRTTADVASETTRNDDREGASSA